MGRVNCPMDDELTALIRKHEGFRASAYEDTRGFLPIGYGRLIDARRGGGITRQEAETLLAADIQQAEQDVQALFAGHEGFTPTRYHALVSMAFNLGRAGLAGFSKMSAAIARNDWEQAAAEPLNSVWARQVPARAQEIARFLKGS